MSVKHAKRLAYVMLGLVPAVMLVGCGPKQTRLNLVTYDDAGAASAHYTDFGRAVYRVRPDKRIELVFRSQAPSRLDPAQTITQLVYIDEFWNPQLGVSYADSTQINSRVQYAILTPPTGVRYDGGAFVTYKFDQFTKEMVGWVESGSLSPASRLGNAAEPFGPARIYGEFRAVEDPATVVHVEQMLKTEFPAADAPK